VISVRWCASLLLAAASLPAQDVLWEMHSVTNTYYNGLAPRFDDFDRDGCDDLLCAAIVDFQMATQRQTLRIHSGRDGTLLDEADVPRLLRNLQGVGDFDGDGFPDYAYLYFDGLILRIVVWSPHRDQALLILQEPQPPTPWGSALTGRLDLNGDGRLDLVVGGGHSLESTLFAYDNSGALLYTIPALAMGFVVRTVAAVGDLDHDGADDFVVGGTEFGPQRGGVVLVSGRTGTPWRLHHGPFAFALLGEDLWNAGDMDGDGVTDYAAGNQSGFFSPVMMAWSGRTGALIREWIIPNLSGVMICGRDVDLDGFTDVMNFVPGFDNVLGNRLRGRVRTLSSRDGQDLVHVSPQAGDPWTLEFGAFRADLGVQPESPYPVFAMSYQLVLNGVNQWPRIRVLRANPAGSRILGDGCSSQGQRTPTIGLRRVATTGADRSRIVLGSAPPGALAFCVAAPDTATAANGATVPLPLDLFGLAGCTLLVPPAIVGAHVTGTAGFDRGYAAVEVPHRIVGSGGMAFAAQWVVLDLATLGYATTARHEFLMQ
jgi:hypothetical protein